MTAGGDARRDPTMSAAAAPDARTKSPPTKPDIRVGFVLLPQFTMLSFAGFLDVLRHASYPADGAGRTHCAWEIVAPTLEPVVASGGVAVTPQALLGDPTRFDCVVVVGGTPSASRRHPPETLAFLRQADDAGLLVAGLCTGCFALAAAGLLDHCRCSVHFRHAEDFRAQFPQADVAIHEVYVFDHNIATCPGGTASIDLAVDIVSRFSSRKRATKGLADLLVDEHRSAFHAPEQPFRDLESCGDQRVEAAIRLMRQDLSGKSTVRDIARTLHLTVGQLNRAFKAHTRLTPTEVYRAMRLQHARWRLLNSDHSVGQIAFDCGFSDGPHFIRWFRRVYGQTPHAARRQRTAVREHDEGLRGDAKAFRRGAPRRTKPARGAPDGVA